MLERFEDLTAECHPGLQEHSADQKTTDGTAWALRATPRSCVFIISPSGGNDCHDLSRITVEDKASISRILAELEEEGYITYETEPGRKYRAPALLTKKAGKPAVKIQQLILPGHGSRRPGGSLTRGAGNFYRALFRLQTISPPSSQTCPSDA